MLCRNSRGHWELPGGRPALGEAFPACLIREIAEETGLAATVSDLIAAGPFEVLPGRWVNVIVYRCALVDDAQPVASHEHERIAFLDPSTLMPDELPEIYRRAIDAHIKRS